MDPLWFFPVRGQRVDLAQAVCARCPEPTRAECLEYALRIGQPLSGVWGGTTGRQRLHLHQERRMVATTEDPLDSAVVEGEREGMTDSVPVADAHVSKDEGTGSVRSCSECGNPLAPERKFTCGPECAAGRKIRMKRAGDRRRRDQTPTGGAPVLVGVSPGQSDGSSATGDGFSAIEANVEEGLQLRGNPLIAIPSIVDGALELVRLASRSGQDVALELRAGGVRLSIG